MGKIIKRLTVVLIAAFVLLPWGCSQVTWSGAKGDVGATTGAQDDESRIRQRVQEYWNLKIKGEFDKSYLYETPEYREQVNLTSYIQSFGSGVKWLKAEVKKVEIAEDRATVWVEVEYRWSMVPTENPMIGSGKETWRRVEGTWFHAKDPKKALKPEKPKLEKELEKLKGGESGEK